MKLESPTKIIPVKTESVFEKIDNPQNLKNLMPDNLESVEVFENGVSFALKGMPKISLEKKQSTKNQLVSYQSKEGKIPFELHFHFKEISAEQTQISATFEGNLNPMLQMVVKTPIGKFIETIINKL